MSTRRAVWDLLGQPWVARLLSLGLVLATGTVIAIAIWLDPSAEGHGTHRQLGLNGCSFLTATGYPCPMCGATTTFTLWAHLDPIRGIVNQPFASLLFLMTAGTFGLGLVEMLDPRDRWRRLLSVLAPYEGRLATAFLAIMGVSWIYKIWLMA